MIDFNRDSQLKGGASMPHTNHVSHQDLRINAYKLLMKRMQIQDIEFLANKAEDMVFSINRKQAISLITLVFNYLNEEWVNAGNSTNGGYCNSGLTTNWFMAGAKRVYQIIKSHALETAVAGKLHNQIHIR